LFYKDLDWFLSWRNIYKFESFWFGMDRKKEGKGLFTKLFGIFDVLETLPSHYAAFAPLGIDSELDSLDISSTRAAWEEQYQKGNEKKEVYLPGLLILLGFFLLSPNITGNVVGESSIAISSFIGLGLLFFGGLGAFLVYKLRKEEIDKN